MPGLAEVRRVAVVLVLLGEWVAMPGLAEVRRVAVVLALLGEWVAKPGLAEVRRVAVVLALPCPCIGLAICAIFVGDPFAEAAPEAMPPAGPAPRTSVGIWHGSAGVGAGCRPPGL